MHAGPNTIVAIGALSFAFGIFLSAMCWNKAVEGKIDLNCPNGKFRANMMLVAWSPQPAPEPRQMTACDERGRRSGIQLANFAVQASNDSTGARINP